MTQRTYDKPDASVCKVWASRLGWAKYSHTGDGGEYWCWAPLTSSPGVWFGTSPRYATSLPPGPWRPCYLVGEEPKREAPDLSDPIRRVVEEYEATYDAERAVLEAAPTLRNALILLMHSSYGVAGLHSSGDVATWDELCRGGKYEEWLKAFDDFDDAVDALRAARRPEKVEKPPMVCVETDIKTPTLVRQWAVGWHGECLHTVAGSVLLRRVLRVLPASQVEGGYTPAEQALADEITKAMEARRAHSPD